MAISTKDKKLQNGLLIKRNKNYFFLILTKVDKYYNFQDEFFGGIMNIVEKGMLKKLKYSSEITKTSKICPNIFYVFEIYPKIFCLKSYMQNSL